jgi:predicted DNA-binding WGR domain protein
MQSYLEKHDTAKNQARFYSMVLLPNLFGEWTLYREWGRILANGRFTQFPVVQATIVVKC